MTSIDTQSDSYIAEISDKLLEARKTSTGLPKFPGELPTTLETAYKIQDRSISKIDDEIRDMTKEESYYYGFRQGKKYFLKQMTKNTNIRNNFKLRK